MLDIAV